jgi:polyhydroxybutyrate depolymerase
MTVRSLLALVAVLGLASVAPAAIAPGSYVRNLEFGGVERNYRLHVPTGYDGTRDVPLLVNVHGFTSNAEQQEVISEAVPLADAHGFVVVHPNGIGNAWNAGTCCGNGNVDDVGFLRTVIEDVAGQARIDRRRIYVTGLSNGGAMSHRMACEAADLVAAVAPMAFPIAYEPITDCQPSRPIAVLSGFGLTDTLVSYEGGQFGSAAGTFARWKELNGCSGAVPDVTVVTGDSRCETYTQCAEGVEASLCSVYANSLIGTPFEGHVLYFNPDLDLSQVIWDFVSRFELPDPPAQHVLSGAGLLRSGRTRGKTTLAWNVTLGNDRWTAADGAGHVYTGTARRLGKSKSYALTPTDDARAALGRVVGGELAALGAPSGDVTIDPRDTLRVETDKAGTPVRVKGVLRLLRDGAPAGRLTVKVKG